MNPVLKTIQERSSIRRYKDTPLTEEELFLLKDAVLAAPTARNLQGLRYYFITDRSIIKQIDQRIMHHASDEMRASQKKRGSESFFYDAPLGVIITAGDQMWLVKMLVSPWESSPLLRNRWDSVTSSSDFPSWLSKRTTLKTAANYLDLKKVRNSASRSRLDTPTRKKLHIKRILT